MTPNDLLIEALTSTCAECGESYYVHPDEDGGTCSPACGDDANDARTACFACGRYDCECAR